MLKRKTVPVSVKYQLVLPQALIDRIERCHAVAQNSGFDLVVEDTLLRSILLGVARWERKLGIGSNATPGKAEGSDPAE